MVPYFEKISTIRLTNQFFKGNKNYNEKDVIMKTVEIERKNIKIKRK